MRALTLVLESAFKNLDQRIDERWSAGNLSHGFWRAGAIPRLTPVDTMREYGFWQATAELPVKLGKNELTGQLSVALIGGHTRMGVFLPNLLLDGVSSWGESLTDAVARAHDGLPAPILRRVGGDTLFDRIFAEAPFSAEWLLRCTRDPDAQAILDTHLAWRVIDLWESAMRMVMARQSRELGIVILSTKPLPPVLTETLPLTLQDAYEIQPGRWITIAPQVDGLDLAEIETQLQNLLPDHGITIQKDAAG